MPRMTLLLLALAVASPAIAADVPHGGPVIDMHLHAFAMDEVPPGMPLCGGDQGVPMPTIDPREEIDFAAMGACEHPLVAPMDDDGLRDGTIAALRQHNVRRGMLQGSVERVAEWRQAAPVLFIPGVAFGVREDKPLDELRRLHAAGQLEVLGEAMIQYRGRSPADPRYQDYFALAEELDIPVAIHLGEGPAATARFPGYEEYRVAMGSPLLLEPVLRAYPKLRIYVMHYGSPLVDEMIAMMFAYPNLYVDVACNNWAMPRAQFHGALERMVDAGFGERILFGTDQMYWPGAVGEAIEAIETAPFLDAKQKRDILYNNAARFLRLSEAEIAADHQPLAR